MQRSIEMCQLAVLATVLFLKGSVPGLSHSAELAYASGIEKQTGSAVQVDHDPPSPPAQKPQPDASGRYHVGNGVTPPRIVHTEEPDFSKKPRFKKIEGITAVSLTVDAHGDPQDVYVSRSLADSVPKKRRDEAIALDQKAVEAVKRYKFAPATFDGEPVPVAAIVEVHFQVH
jgi:Gram-negative bacterial TonB protein C-terminal